MRTSLRPVRPLLLVALALAVTAGAGAAEVPRYSIEDFLTTTSLRGGSFSPDKSKILVSSDQSGVFNAVAIPVDGKPAVELTHSTVDGVNVVSYFPADERFLYVSDQGGNENDHVYVRELDGRVVDLTPGDKLKADFLKWAQDDKSFFVISNERDAKFFDVYEIQLEGYKRSLFYQDDQGLQVGDISPDKRYIAFGKPATTTDVDVLLYDRQTKELKNITQHEGEVNNLPQAFSPDGKALYFTTDQGSEFSYLARYDLASGKVSEVVRPEWDLVSATFSKNGEFLGVLINHDARNELRLFRAATMERVALPELPGLDIGMIRFSNDAKRLAFYGFSGRSPSNLFVFDLGDKAPRQLTQTLNAKIKPEHLVEGEVVRFASFDGRQVPGILYQPHGASPAHKVPALLWVHGGPGGQSRIGYSGLVQFLVNHGYAVYAINNRGSSGYGKTFFKLDDRNHGDGDLKDCVESKKMLAATGWVDPARIGILGGSYGGYMVLAALAFEPQEFNVGVDLFGVSNWLRTMKSIPPYWESFRKALYQEIGDPAVDEEYLRRISPLFHAKNIVKPLFVLQGANDPRVIKPESDEIVAAARANGVPVEYLVFDDEGHGIEKKANQFKAYQAVLTFLDTHLKTAAAKPAGPAS